MSCLLFICGFAISSISFSQNINTIAGNGKNSRWGNGGPAVDASVPYPTGICTDAAGNLYVTTSETVRKVQKSTGIITAFAGNNRLGYGGDGGPAINASMKSPVAVCTDQKGNVFIAEYNGHRIRRVSPDGIIITVAGNGQPGFQGDGGPAIAASLNTPRGIATDAAGHLYITDFYNNRIRRVDATTGIITTIGGNGHAVSAGDGEFAAHATVVAPTAICVSKAGDVFFTEADLNQSCRVRKITMATGTINTVAGTDRIGFGGDGGPALQAALFLPTGLAVDEMENVFIAEHNGSRIRRVDAVSGLITTIAGNGTPGFCCDGGPAANALLNNPLGLAIDNEGNLFIADNNNHRIRQIETRLSCIAPTLTLTASSALFCYNASPQFTASLSGSLANTVYRWKINGIVAGIGGSSESLAVKVGDVVSCEVSGINACNESISVASNSIPISSNPGYDRGPEVTIMADKTSICAGTGVTFTATNVSESAAPIFQWLVDGRPAGTNSPIFVTTTLANGNKVECIMTVPHCGSNGGSTKDYSNAIVVKVDQPPVIYFYPDHFIIDPGTQVQLKPQAQGAIASYQWTPSSLLADPTAFAPVTKTLYSTTTFLLKAQTAAGCEAAASVTVTVYGGLHLPNAFTPNGDGRNDVFRIPPTAAFRLKDFRVFDRWGKIIFQTTNSHKGWDGKTGGVAAGAGTYVYTVSGEDHKGPLFLKGTVQLIR